MNLMLDKELYNVEETEDANGKKMIRITPKTEKGNNRNTSARNSRNRMQPYASQLNLIYNTTDKRLTVDFTLHEKRNTIVTITGPKGKEVFKDRLKKFSGNYKKEIRLKGNGLYTVKVVQDKLNITESIEVE
jgi:hypothetical protein